MFSKVNESNQPSATKKTKKAVSTPQQNSRSTQQSCASCTGLHRRARYKSDCRYHARVHFSCVICIAAAFQLLPLFIFSMFIFVYFFTQTDPTRTVQRSALCRSRRELSKDYLVVKIGFDTADNELCKVCSLSVYRSPRFHRLISCFVVLQHLFHSFLAVE